MLKLILEHSLGSERPKRAKMSPKEPSGASKNQKPSFPKTLKNPVFFKGFWLQRLLKKASRGPRWLPKDTRKIQDPKNRNPKLIPRIIKKSGTNFWTHSKTQAQLKKSKTESILETPFPRISGIQIMPCQKVNERGKKRVLTGIILYKRKGGIRPYKAF